MTTLPTYIEASCGDQQIRCLNLTASSLSYYCMSESDFTCDSYEWCDCPSLKGNPDIAGIGVRCKAFMLLNPAYILDRW